MIEFVKALKRVITEDEGSRLFPYVDTTGHITIGIGRNLTDRGISSAEESILFENDIEYHTNTLPSKIAFYNDLDDVRKIVLVNMSFNLGINGLLNFAKMLEALKNKDWDRAATEILNSKAYRQAPNRYKRLSEMMRTGNLPQGTLLDDKGNTQSIAATH